MIDILMSTYNGEEFLRPQLDSILTQDHREIRLLVRDDGSTDSTQSILDEYAAKDDRMSLIEDGAGNLGAFVSFMELVSRSTSPYFMFSDQDDVWLPDKVSRTMTKMNAVGVESRQDEPIAIFTDMTVVDDNLNVVHPSLWRYQGYEPAISRNWKKLLAQNVVLGCTLMANARVRELCIPFMLPELPHDHWVALHAAKYGTIDFIDVPTMLYRQHTQNYSGAHRFGIGYSIERLPGLIPRIGEFMRSSRFFGGVSPVRLLFYKVWLNLRRFRSRDHHSK